MKRLLGRLICALTRRHKRGKFHSLIRAQGSDTVVERMFICPRCDSTWTRKIKAA